MDAKVSHATLQSWVWSTGRVGRVQDGKATNDLSSFQGADMARLTAVRGTQYLVFECLTAFTLDAWKLSSIEGKTKGRSKNTLWWHWWQLCWYRLWRPLDRPTLHETMLAFSRMIDPALCRMHHTWLGGLTGQICQHRGWRWGWSRQKDPWRCLFRGLVSSCF